jgi:hypothetical protein
MMSRLAKLRICPACFSTESLEEFPEPGKATCSKCGHEIISVFIRAMFEDDALSEPCPHCLKEGEDNEPVYDDGEIVIYKCKACGKLAGYKIIEPKEDLFFDVGNEDLCDSDFSNQQIKTATQEGHIILSASKSKQVAKEIQKAQNDPKEKLREHLRAHLRQFAENKTEALKACGVKPEIIGDAIFKVYCYINKTEKLTEKQIETLFAASIYLVQDETVWRDNKAAKITERTAQDIFGTDRKTLRKWKNKIKSKIASMSPEN